MKRKGTSLSLIIMKTSKTFKKVLGGSMAAATLAGVGIAAQAPVASASDWDRLAECESGGDWSINTGNGFYGGLQFSQQSWEAVGGSGLPSDASKEEQIQRATQLQNIQGWGAWPACSASLGLSGSPSTAGQTAEDNSAQEQTQEEAAPAEQEQAEAPVQEETEAPVQEEAPEPEVVQEQEAPQTEAPDYSVAGEAAEPQAEVETSDETYTVEAGDSLSSIADSLDLEWEDLWAANKDLIEDPNVIFVGDELKLPVAG